MYVVLTNCYSSDERYQVFIYFIIIIIIDFNSTMQARVAHESSDIKRISLVSWIQLQKICNLGNTLQFTVDIKYMNLSRADL